MVTHHLHLFNIFKFIYMSWRKHTCHSIPQIIEESNDYAWIKTHKCLFHFTYVIRLVEKLSKPPNNVGKFLSQLVVVSRLFWIFHFNAMDSKEFEWKCLFFFFLFFLFGVKIFETIVNLKISSIFFRIIYYDLINFSSCSMLLKNESDYLIDS